MIRYAMPEDKPQLRALWDICFPGDDKFADYFFAQLYQDAQALLFVLDDGTISSMLHLLPYTIVREGVIHKATYIYGVGTHPACRRQGQSRLLIDQAFFEVHLRGNAFAFLIPQEPWLFDFYQQFGFQTVFHHHTFTVGDSALHFAKPATVSDIPDLSQRYEQHHRGQTYVARTGEQWQQILQEATVMTLPDGYLIRSGDRILEAYGTECGCQMTDVPYGMVRVIKAGIWGQTLSITDPMCPWNNNEGTLSHTPQSLATYLFSNPYMNLMHD